MKHTLHIFCCLALGLLALLASCYDGWDEQVAPLASGGEAVVKVSVPAGGGFGTKAYGDATEEAERAVHSLWLLAYPVDGENGEALVCLLNGSGTLEHDTWRTYNVRMKLGKYNVYVVANVEGINTITTEEQLKNMFLNYTTGNSSSDLQWLLPNVADGLPMVYQSAEPFEVTAQGGTIWAELEFTCVKVTYTLTFDNTEQTGCSFPTFGKNYLTVENVTGKQIATEAPLLPDYEPRAEMELKNTEEGAFNGSRDGDVPPGKWTYTATFYLPEHYVDKDEQDKQTYLDMTAALYSETGEKRANLQYTIPLGGLKDGTVNAEGYDRSELRRGTWYQIEGEITSLGGVIEATVVVEPWKVAEVDTDLESAYHLWVQDTEIESLAAGQTVTIPCRTDAPRLEAYSPTIESRDENGNITLSRREIYIVTFNDDYTAFTVQINPTIPLSTTWLADLYNHIFIRIPDPETGEYLLSKRIDIKNVSTEPYFHVTPPQYTIYLTEIGHEATYTVTFTYETNMTDVKVTCGGSNVLQSGIKWDENSNVTIADSGLKEDGTGTVTVTLDKPYDPSHYTKTQTITIDYVATDNRDALLREEEQTTVTIIPNAQTYRLHFRPVTDDWTNPHIYVYQVLYAPDGKEVRLTGDDVEHAVRYGFTGKRTYLGWTSQGGTIQDPGPNSDIDEYATYWKVKTNAYNPGHADAHYVYNTSIDYCPDFRGGTPCGQCSGNQVNPKWPGVAMKADDENPGWFYFDLPALAEPGTTLIMFANTHNANDGGTISDQYRYPAHMVPGVPLYDYADKDGWFLYDYTKGDDNGFVDDKPNVLDKRDVLPNGTYRIWCNTTSTNIHIWGDGNYTIYDDANSGKLLVDEESGRKYFDLVVSDSWNPQTVMYLFHTGNSNSTGDLSIGMAEWRKVTGKTYDYEVYK